MNSKVDKLESTFYYENVNWTWGGVCTPASGWLAEE